MGIEHGDAVLARIVEIDLIGADAEAADGRERRTCVDDFAGHAGFGANAQQINVFQASMSSSSLRRPEALDFEAVVTQ